MAGIPRPVRPKLNLRPMVTGPGGEMWRPDRRYAGSADDLDVLRLGPLLALSDVELDLLSFLQAAVAASADRAEVHEHVLPALDGDEAVALIAVEPLHSALRHCDLLCPGGSAARHGVRASAG